MADDFIIQNSWMCYIKNLPYVYPNDDDALTPAPSGSGAGSFNTGWQILPNMLWKHFATPKQWAELCIGYEAYHVESMTFDIFNMIPMTQQLAIQGNSIFTAFNNCIYAVAYEDKLYETSWENWYNPTIDEGLNLLYKEGQTCRNGTNTKVQKILPTYVWSVPNQRAANNATYGTWHDLWQNPGNGQIMDPVYPAQATNFSKKPTGVLWDPFNRPEDLMELRPGKNSIKMSWNCADVDEGKWFNIDQIAWWWPYTAAGPYDIHKQRPGELRLTTEVDPDRLATQNEQTPPINDYTIPNWANIPVCPMQWWWKEIQSCCAPASSQQWYLRVNEYFAGTEAECYKYGPHQMFIKMIPLFDGNGTHIACNANVSVKTTLRLKVKKRRSAFFAPTWGPWSWYDLYTAQSAKRRFAPTLIRYRTGGMRRTWQNIADDTGSGGETMHPRETPYNPHSTVAQGSGAGNTRNTPTVVFAKTSGEPTVTIQMQQRPRPTPKIQPSAPPAEDMETGETVGPDRLYPPLDMLRRNRV